LLEFIDINGRTGMDDQNQDSLIHQYRIRKTSSLKETDIQKEGIKRLNGIEKRLNTSILGQDEAVEKTVSLVKLSYAGLRDESKPAAVLLFSGPSGTGKTELTRQLANELGKDLVRFDMSEYKERISVTKLFGAAPGYAGYENGGMLVTAIRAKPNSVLLLDEIDKAHPDIYDVLLQIMDYATLTDNKGLKADFRKVIIIMTSNAGVREQSQKQVGFVRIRDDGAVDRAIERMFSPEFRNRLDGTVKFNRLSPDIIHSIVRNQINDLVIKLKKQKKITLHVTETCIEKIASESYNEEFGAREVGRLIEKSIKNPLVDDILFGRLSKGGSAKADWRQGDGYITDIAGGFFKKNRIFFT